MLEDVGLIIFDFDGVLIESRRLYLYAFQKSLAKQGYRYSCKQIMPFLGPRVEVVISNLISRNDEKREEKILRAKEYLDRFASSKEGMRLIKIKPYAKEAIKQLKRRRFLLTLLTNSDRTFVNSVLKKYSLLRYWDKIIAADDGFEKKEDAALSLIKKFNTTPEKTVYIADMAHDIEIARNVGCRIAIIPGWNSFEKMKKERPDYLFRNLKELVTSFPKNL